LAAEGRDGAAGAPSVLSDEVAAFEFFRRQVVPSDARKEREAWKHALKALYAQAKHESTAVARCAPPVSLALAGRVSQRGPASREPIRHPALPPLVSAAASARSDVSIGSGQPR
jgi:hypothetical protein